VPAGTLPEALRPLGRQASQQAGTGAETETGRPAIGVQPALALERVPSSSEDAQFSDECQPDSQAGEEDLRLATKWLEKAATGGRAEAQFNLAVCLEHGLAHVLHPDLEAAIRWYRGAAQGGVSEAKGRLGYLLAQKAANLSSLSDNAARDAVLREALQWLTTAMQTGSLDAAVHLGQLFERGIGTIIPRDPYTALEYFRLAAASHGQRQRQRGHVAVGADAGLRLHAALAAANILFDMGAMATDQGKEEILALYEQAAGGGVADAQNALGILFEDGIHVQRDLEAAERWFNVAASNGHRDATLNLESIQERARRMNTRACPSAE